MGGAEKIKIYEPVEKIMILVPGCGNGCKAEIFSIFLKNNQENFCIDRNLSCLEKVEN
jgi:hypothetical protein